MEIDLKKLKEGRNHTEERRPLRRQLIFKISD